MVEFNKTKKARIAGIELGGTKAIAILANGTDICEEFQIPTQDPTTTLGKLREKLESWWTDHPFDALGIASFGPVALERKARDYGHIRTTTKAGWSGADIVGTLGASFDCPIAIESDVNAAAMAEYQWGIGQGCSSLIYITIGTGVGGGVILDGSPLHGQLHPEIGHVSLQRSKDDKFKGACSFHGDCIEGLISGPALHARFNQDPANVPASDSRWHQVADDLASLCAMLIYAYAPKHILIGGGVGIGAPHLLEMVHKRLPIILKGYYAGFDEQAAQTMICHPKLHDKAGPMGAVAVGLNILYT